MSREQRKQIQDWNSKGCKKCRGAWETGQRLHELEVSRSRHATLSRCRDCGTYWEEFERYADIISPEEVVIHYPKVNL